MTPAICRTFAVLRAALLFTLACFASLALAAPGDVAQTQLLKIPGGIDKSYAIAVQPDGKMVAAGYAYLGTKQFAITRYNADGSVDASFGDAGTRLEWLGPGDAEAHAIAVQSSGKIVVAGSATSDISRFGIARFNSDGSLDTSFGGGGAVTTIGTGSAALAMALQADDKIVLGGWSTSGGTKAFTLVRYGASSPLLDTGFGSGGIVVASPGSVDEQINAIAIQSDGKIVAAGSDGNNATLVRRYNADGTLDTGFGSGGTFFTSTMAARGVAVLANGSILVAGRLSGGGTFQVARLTSAGALDTTFGVNGFAQQGTGSTSGGASALGVQSDGKIVVAGTGTASGAAIAVARFNANGSNDTGFGNSGVTIRKMTIQDDEGDALAILASGELVVAGAGNRSPADCACTPTSSATGALLVGFTSSGALDSAFAGGLSVLNRGSKASAGFASAIQSDGKLVVAGLQHPTPSETDGVVNGITSGSLARFNPDGTLDTSFGTGGIVATTPKQLRAVAIQSDGKIVAAGFDDGNFQGIDAERIIVARFNANGALDSGFGNGGIVSVPLDGPTEEAFAIALQSDGRIVVGGLGQMQGSFSDALFVRLNSDGTLDTSFGGSGKVRVAMSTGSDQLNALAIQPDGKIVGAGWGQLSGSQDGFAVARLNSDGSLDSTFGGSGVVSTPIGTSIAHGNAVALQTDGRIVVGGQAFGSGTDDFALVRYNTDGTLDTTFGTGGKVTTDVGNHNRIFALTILPSGKITAAGQWAASFGLIQYLPSGAVDTSFGSGGSVFLTMNNATNEIAHSIVQRSDGNLWVSGEASGVVGLALIAGDGASLATPSVTLASSVNPSGSGQSVTFTATVSGTAGTPTGTVAFKDGTTTLSGCAAVAVTSGQAACTTSALASGTHSITAAYSGDGHYSSRTSTALTQTVNGTAGAPASITSPTPGSTLTGTSQLFQWNDAGASLYQLWVGSTQGAYDVGYFPQNGTTGTSVTATGLPTDGRTLYVRLYSNINGAYQFRDFTYTAAGSGGGGPPTPASITSPTPASTLTGTSQVFQWNNAGASLYQLWVGSTQGAYDIGYFPQSGTTGTSATATGLPTDGRTLYVRLYSAINGAWQFRDFTYTAAGSGGGGPPMPASITSPTPGSTLTGSSQLFQWNNSGASLYQLWVGSTQGAYDVGYFPQSGTTGTSVAATGLPTDGRKLYVRLYSAINGAWQFRDFTYTASGSGGGGGTPTPATMASPAPGSRLSGSTVTFNWNAAAGASLYQVWVGTTPGAYDVGYFPQSGTTGTSATATGLPTDGRTLYVRLYSAINNTWYFNDYTYMSGP